MSHSMAVRSGNIGTKAMEFYERYLKPLKVDIWDVLYYMIRTKSAVPSQKWLTYNRFLDHDSAVSWWKCQYHAADVGLLDIFRVFGRQSSRYECLELTRRLRFKEMASWEDMKARALALRDGNPEAVTQHLIRHNEVTEQDMYDAPTPVSSVRSQLDPSEHDELFGSDNDIHMQEVVTIAE